MEESCELISLLDNALNYDANVIRKAALEIVPSRNTPTGVGKTALLLIILSAP